MENEKHKVEEEKGRIALALQQLDKDKKQADQTISMLKEEIDKEKGESDTEISALLERLEQERTVNHQMIQALNGVVAQKEERRLKMKTLIQQLENDSQVNTESIKQLRSELENQEEEYRMYGQHAETDMKALQDESQKMMFQKVELLKHVLEQVVAVVLLHERKYIKETMKEKKIEEGIRSLKTDYYAGETEYKKIEALVNRYLDNVMIHFRKEVVLTNESEYRRVCYMFAGVSGQIIGEIMGESKDAVYQRRSRLLKKIASLSCFHKEMFIVLLSK